MNTTELIVLCGLIGTGVSTACAVITAIVPPPKNPRWKRLYNIINVLGANVGHAKNAGGK